MLAKSSFEFLSALEQNNHRDWFQQHAKDYDAYKKDYHQMIDSLLEVLKSWDADLANLEVKNCTFRINRDIRFSKDKSPYKTHMSMWFSKNKLQKNAPGYYLHLHPKGSFVAGGLWCPEAADLHLIRKELAFFYEDLDQIISDKHFKKYYNGLDQDTNHMLKTSPKNFEKDHPASHWLKYKSFTASHYFDLAEAFHPNFAQQVAAKMKPLKPLNDFLVRALTENE